MRTGQLYQVGKRGEGKYLWTRIVLKSLQLKRVSQVIIKYELNQLSLILPLEKVLAVGTIENTLDKKEQENDMIPDNDVKIY